MSIASVKFTIAGQTYDLTYDSASGTYKATLTAPGTTSWNETDHKIYGTVTAVDDAGNETVVTKAEFSELGLRVLEKGKPTIKVNYPTAGAFVTSAMPTIEWEVTDAASGIDLATLVLQIDGGARITSADITTEAITSGYKCTYTPPTALREGAHTIYFDVSDNDGNAAARASVAITVDTVPPALSLDSPEDGLVTNQETITISGTTSDTTSGTPTVEVYLNGGAAKAAEVGSNGKFSINVKLTSGTNAIRVVATDAAGKFTEITRTVTLDTGAPVFVSVTLTPNPVDAGATYIIEVEVTD